MWFHQTSCSTQHGARYSTDVSMTDRACPTLRAESAYGRLLVRHGSGSHAMRRGRNADTSTNQLPFVNSHTSHPKLQPLPCITLLTALATFVIDW